MNGNNSNTFLAIGLSVLVLVLWQVFYIAPIVEEERKQAEIIAQREAVQSGQAEPSENEAIPQSDTATTQAPANIRLKIQKIPRSLPFFHRATVPTHILRNSAICDLQQRVKYQAQIQYGIVVQIP